LVLCAPPVVLLGVVSPFAIRLAVSSIATAGAVAGRLYALSTAGSLLGTFLPALVLIPGIGTQRPFLAIAALLAASSCFLLGARYLVIPALIAALLLVPPGATKGEDGLIHEETSLYQYIAVVQRPDGRRVLHLNEGVAIHSLWWPYSVLTGGEWATSLAVPPPPRTPYIYYAAIVLLDATPDSTATSRTATSSLSHDAPLSFGSFTLFLSFS